MVPSARNFARRHSAGRDARPLFAQRKSSRKAALDGKDRDRLTDGGHRMGDAATTYHPPALRRARGGLVHTGFRGHLRYRGRTSVAGRRPRPPSETLDRYRVRVPRTLQLTSVVYDLT